MKTVGEIMLPAWGFLMIGMGPGQEWFGNFTRHRTAAPSEMQRLNTTFEGSNHNMMAFGPIKFVE